MATPQPSDMALMQISSTEFLLQEKKEKKHMSSALNERNQSQVNGVWNHTMLNELLKDHHGNYYRMVVDGKQKTYTWKKAGRISELVRICSMSPTTEEDVVIVTGHVSESQDARFPYLKKERHEFTFPNGVYFALTDVFLLWEDPIIINRIESKSLIAAKYFPFAFENDRYIEEMKMGETNKFDWTRIPTDAFERLLIKQEWPSVVREWFYVLLGQLLFERNELDKWQNTVCLKGQEGCGLEVDAILKVVTNLYDQEDVVVIDTHTPTKIMTDMHSSLLYVGRGSNTAVTKSTWCSMNNGDEVLNEESKVVRWKVPGVVTWEFLGDWVDKCGELAGRLLLLVVSKPFAPLHEEKSRLGFYGDLHRNMGALIKKISIAYISTAAVSGHVDKWKMLPEYFTASRRRYFSHGNLLQEFLLSERIALGGSCQMGEFRIVFNEYCKTQGCLSVPAWTEDYYMHVFQSHVPPIEVIPSTFVTDLNFSKIRGIHIRL